MLDRPRVYDYLDYREFCKDISLFLKAKKQISQTSIGQQAGFKSRSYFRMIVSGDRNISEDTARKLAKAFHLPKKEQDFFVLLVLHNQERKFSVQLAYQKKLEKFRQQNKVKLMEDDLLKLLSTWHTIAIYESISMESSHIDITELAKRMKTKPGEIKRSLNLLESMNLIQRDSENRWTRTSESLRTPPIIKELFVKSFHAEMIRKALDHLENSEDDATHNFSSLTLCLTSDGFNKLRQQLWESIVEYDDKYSKREGADAVFQLNIQLFPLLGLKTFE